MAMLTTGDATLEDLRFSNSFAHLPPAFHEARVPTGIPNAKLVAFSRDAAELIDLRAGQELRPEFTAIAGGNALLRGMEPVAAVYAGHQFGSFVSQLGDGRAILLGEVRNARGESWELQLKGAGLTAFSRFGDGRAVLRSTIREFLCSEAMHALGIPTTRALAMTAGDEPVFREKPETAAMLVRMAPTFVRFGSFEFFHARRQPDEVKLLADYTIDRWFPEAGAGAGRYARFFESVVRRTAELMAAWQAVGFAHGVMNTDNFSIVGLTLDYGPFGFLDTYEPGFICNHTDAGGRYAFERQPSVGLWNCYALANALLSLVSKDELEAALATYENTYRLSYMRRIYDKLGLIEPRESDVDLLLELMRLLEANRVDYTRFFRALCEIDAESSPGDEAAAALVNGDAWNAWQMRYKLRLAEDAHTLARRRALKRSVNPKYVLRNYLAQEAIERAQNGDYSQVEALQRALSRPFDEQPEFERFADAPPDWSRTISVSCSS